MFSVYRIDGIDIYTFRVEGLCSRWKTKWRLLPRGELLGPIAVERQNEMGSEIDGRLGSR